MSEFKTLKKYTDDIPNEDSCIVQKNMIAISDGAGGCGVFANEWSAYLVENIKKKCSDLPILNFEQFDEWIDEIWESFYDDHEKIAKQYDSTFQNKFYHEGSCATLVVAWRTESNVCHWISYGDSVIFHYNKSKGILEHSFTKLSDFFKSPCLINCMDSLEKDGFNSGKFIVEDDSVIFAASDALSHYILMIYYITHQNQYKKEIEEIINSHTSDAQMLSLAMNDSSISFDMLIAKLQDISKNQNSFDQFVIELNKRGVLDLDDYTLAILKYDNSLCNIL